MQVSVEKKEGIRCILNIELPPTEIDQEVTKRVHRIAKTAKVDGFRPGKVPMGVIKKKYGKQIRFEVLGDILPKKYGRAIEEKNLNAAGVEIEILNNKEGEKVSFNVNIELFPEVVIQDLDKITIEKPIVKIEDQEIKQMVNKLQQQFATWKDVERTVKINDCVTVDFVGQIEGKEFEGGSATSFDITIGSNQMIPGFEDGIVGMKKNEEKILDVTFPKNYKNNDLKGKEAQFSILVKNVKESQLPDIDSEFIKKCGIKGNIDAFYSEIKENMIHQSKNIISKTVKKQVFKQLTDLIDFELPKILVQREIDRSKHDLIKHLKDADANSKIKVENLPDDLFIKKSKNSVKLSLILQEIIKNQKIEADQDSINTIIKKMSSMYENTQEIHDHIKNNKKEMENIKGLVIEDKIVDWILKQIGENAITEKSEDFFELMKESSSQGVNF